MSRNLSPKSLITCCRIIFAEHWLHRNIISDVGTNSLSEKIRRFYRKLTTEQGISSSYNYHSNDEAEAYIKFINITMEKCYDIKTDVNLDLLYIRSMSIGPGLPSLATGLFNRWIRCLLLRINRPPMLSDYNENHYKALKHHKANWPRAVILSKSLFVLHIGSTVAVSWEDGGPWMHGTMIDYDNEDHNRRLYRIHITRTRWVLTINTGHIKHTPIAVENIQGQVIEKWWIQMNKWWHIDTMNKKYEKTQSTYPHSVAGQVKWWNKPCKLTMQILTAREGK